VSDDVSRLIFDQLQRERRRERHATYFKYAVLLGLGVGYLSVLAMGFSLRDNKPDEPYVAVVRIEGEIIAGKSAAAKVVTPVLDKAFADKDAKGVVLIINSPGGTPVQSALIHDRIQYLKAKHNKSVAVVGQDLLTSGAYLIAVAGDHIAANRSTLVGSIGVVSRGFGFTGLLDKLGVERRVMTAGESKNLLDPFGPQTEQDKLKQAELLEAIHAHFKEIVIAGRKERLNLETEGLFSGTVWTGEQALKAGLIDELADAQQVARERFGVEKMFEYSRTRSLLDRVLTTVSATVADELAPKIQGPMAVP